MLIVFSRPFFLTCSAGYHQVFVNSWQSQSQIVALFVDLALLGQIICYHNENGVTGLSNYDYKLKTGLQSQVRADEASSRDPATARPPHQRKLQFPDAKPPFFFFLFFVFFFFHSISLSDKMPFLTLSLILCSIPTRIKLKVSMLISETLKLPCL